MPLRARVCPLSRRPSAVRDLRFAQRGVRGVLLVGVRVRPVVVGHDWGMAEPREIGVTSPLPQRLSRSDRSRPVDEFILRAGRARAALEAPGCGTSARRPSAVASQRCCTVSLGIRVGSGIDARWVVIEGDQDFFRMTKRLHNRLHGSAGTTACWGGVKRTTTKR